MAGTGATLRRIGTAAAICAAAGTAAGAGGVEWEVAPDFEGRKARVAISGAACAGRPGGGAWCLAVNDETFYAQFFAIAGLRLAPGPPVAVLRKVAGEEPDLEAAAYAGGYFYVAGSHGAPRRGGPVQPSRFFVVRLPVDPADGTPLFTPDKRDVAPGIEPSRRLVEAIRAAGIGCGPDAARVRDSRPCTDIEGMAVLGGRAYFGFRAPVTDAGAAVLAVSAEALFGDGPLGESLHRLRLGAGYGIRDLAPLGDGLLILAGAAAPGSRLAPAIWFWRPGGGPAVHLSDPEAGAGWKAEGLLVLGREAGGVRVLVFFDGRRNGRPTGYLLPFGG